MKVFISWSGEESKAIAQILREELPVVINAIDPFVSSEDIEKGVPWFQNISQTLEDSSFGIVCLTPSNLQSKWLHFEAGALAAKVSQSHVAPLLIDVEEAAVKAPFSQFQLTKLEQADFLKLLLAINRAVKEKPLNEETLKRSFAIWWPQFEKKAKIALESVPKRHVPKIQRTDREILEEVLVLVRTQAMASSFQPGEDWTNQIRNYFVHSPSRYSDYFKSPNKQMWNFPINQLLWNYLANAESEKEKPDTKEEKAEQGNPPKKKKGEQEAE